MHNSFDTTFLPQGDKRLIELCNKTGNLQRTMIQFIQQVDSEDISNQIVKPDYVLDQLIRSSK